MLKKYPGRTVIKAVVFLQEDKTTKSGVAFYSQMRFDSIMNPKEDKVVTMNAKQRKLCNEGMKKVNEQVKGSDEDMPKGYRK